MLWSADGLTGVLSRSPEPPAPHNDRRVRVLVLIPTLDVGGAEMDLVRTLPKIDRTRFEVSVCTFLARGELGKVLQDQGIDVVGPFSASLYWFRHILRRIARRMWSLLWVPVAGKLYALRRVVRRIARPMRPLLKPAARMLRQVVRICRQPLRAFYSIKAV